jgi:hypothetical protein
MDAETAGEQCVPAIFTDGVLQAEYYVSIAETIRFSNIISILKTTKPSGL